MSEEGKSKIFENADFGGIPGLEPAPEPQEQALEPQAQAPDPLQELKEFADQSSIGKTELPAALPFSLLIDGILTQEERDKLLAVLARENMGIAESDLEPQFASGRVLIPRISEYAGVLLVQALRGCSAEMRLGPSDSIFATEDTRNSPDENFRMLDGETHYSFVEAAHEAEHLPVSKDSVLPGAGRLAVIDTLIVSASLRSQMVEAEKSSEYQEVLESLMRELKYRAYRKGAGGIIQLSVQLDSLNQPARYRLTVSGTAVKLEAQF